MEVIYYMRNYYPLTAAQKMHHNWIMDYGTQQVSGVSVVASEIGRASCRERV